MLPGLCELRATPRHPHANTPLRWCVTACHSQRDGQQDQNSGRMQQGSVDHRAGPPPPETVDPTQEQVCSQLGDSLSGFEPRQEPNRFLNLDPLGIFRREQAVTRSLGIATPAPSLDAVVLQYERELRAMDLIVRQHEASLAAQSQQVQSMQVRPRGLTVPERLPPSRRTCFYDGEWGAQSAGQRSFKRGR